MKRPALLNRAPRLRWQPPEASPLVPDEAAGDYPALVEDLTILADELLPAFHELDAEALRAQNSYRRFQLTLIMGGLVTTTLGAVQAGAGGGVLALGLVQAAVAFAVGASTLYLARSRAEQRYLSARLKAEGLRREYFLFLGRLGPYASLESGPRGATLRRRVVEIELEDEGPA